MSGEPLAQNDATARAAAGVAQNPAVQKAAQDAATRAAQDPAVQQAAMSAAGQAAGTAARAAGSIAMRATTTVASEVHIYLQKNHYSVAALSFVGGLLLIVFAVVDLVFFFSLKNFLFWFLNFYRLLFGICICVIEGPVENWPQMEKTVLTYASILQNPATRSTFYLFIACMEWDEAAGPWYHKVVAIYFVAISMVSMFVQCYTALGRGQLPRAREMASA